jgi:hypothetical protein
MDEEGRGESQGPQDAGATNVVEMPISTGSGGCTVIPIRSPDGGVTFGCSGGCGFVDKLLGRSCTKVSQDTPAGRQIFCHCSGGWWDRIRGL